MQPRYTDAMMNNLKPINLLEVVTDDKDFNKALSVLKRHDIMDATRISAFGISLLQGYVYECDVEDLLMDCARHNIDAYIRDDQ